MLDFWSKWKLGAGEADAVSETLASGQSKLELAGIRVGPVYLSCQWLMLCCGEVGDIEALLCCPFSRLGGIGLPLNAIEAYGKCWRLKGNAKGEAPANGAA